MNGMLELLPCESANLLAFAVKVVSVASLMTSSESRSLLQKPLFQKIMHASGSQFGEIVVGHSAQGSFPQIVTYFTAWTFYVSYRTSRVNIVGALP